MRHRSSQQALAARADDGGRAQRARRGGAQAQGNVDRAEQEIRAGALREARRAARALQPGRSSPSSAAIRAAPSPSTSRRSRSIPDSYKAEFNLGRLYAQTGDRAAEEAAYRKAIERQPRVRRRVSLSRESCSSTAGSGLDEAVTLAKKGIELGPTSAYAPLGHYVMADIYSRLGRHADAAAEAQRGRALESRPHPSKVAGG